MITKKSNRFELWEFKAIAFCKNIATASRSHGWSGVSTHNVRFSSVDINSAERSGRAEVLTCSATDTRFGIDSRDRYTRPSLHHSYCTRRTVTCTIATLHTVAICHTIVRHDDGKSNMNVCLFFPADRVDSPCRADIATTGTFRTAPATLERHLRLQKRLQLC